MSEERNEEIEELVELLKKVLNTPEPEFSDEQFRESDPIYVAEMEGIGAMLVMEKTSYHIEHLHDPESVVFSQRHIKQFMTEDGSTERQPQQTSILIGKDDLPGILMELISIAEHFGLTPEED